MGNQTVANKFRYTVALLSEFSEAALSNAQQLIIESELLLENGHFGRSYFLAVAAIEEIGKAYIAFDAQGRDLKDSAVTSKIKSSIENHSNKIRSAFLAYSRTLDKTEIRDNFQNILGFTIALQHGREPSMYADLDYENHEVILPKDAVRKIAAKDCIRLAKHCYRNTQTYIERGQPRIINSNEDAFYAMKNQKTYKMLNSNDFWAFYIARMEAGNEDAAETVVLYERLYFSKGKSFLESR